MALIVSTVWITPGVTFTCRSPIVFTITDAPTIRSLKFALQDEFEDWRDGEMMLQSLIDTPEKVERATRRQAELERLYLESGGIAGPGSLGEPVEEVAP